jgi:hypothetical protein
LTITSSLAAARREQLLRELARCDRELLEINHADIDRAPAYLVELGRQDWLSKRHLIEQELAEPGASSPSVVGHKPGAKRRSAPPPEEEGGA